MQFATIIASTLAIATGALASPVLEARAGVECGSVQYAPIGDVKDCINYLKDKGTQQCKVGGGNGGFCTSGSAVILGSGITETNCQNVAAAAEAILGSCTNSQGYAGGQSTIGGNNNVHVVVKHT